MEGVGEKRIGKRDETRPDTFDGVVTFDFPDDFGQRRQNHKADDECPVGFASNQKQHKEKSVEECGCPEAFDDACRVEIHESESSSSSPSSRIKVRLSFVK